MTMDMRKQLLSLAHIVLLGVGFALTCSGVYLVSLQTEGGDPWSVVPAYLMIVFGVVAVLVGVFWTLLHSMKSKLYHRGAGWEEHIQVFTIERPSSFPPSYEASQSDHVHPDTHSDFVVVTSDGLDVTLDLAPPLYSRDRSEAPDCTWSWERPPRYSQVERAQ